MEFFSLNHMVAKISSNIGQGEVVKSQECMRSVSDEYQENTPDTPGIQLNMIAHDMNGPMF